MAHFAELDQNNVVLRVIVVDNSRTHDSNGTESEALGVAFCQQLFGVDTKWKQTSYNNKIRIRYAGIGYTYDEDLDAFIPPKPFPSWTLDPVTVDWKAPVETPALTEEQIQQGCRYHWNEENQVWELYSPPTQN